MAFYLLNRSLNPTKDTSRNLSNQDSLLNRQKSGSSYLDWSLKIDLKKNTERMIQTKPILIDES